MLYGQLYGVSFLYAPLQKKNGFQELNSDNKIYIETTSVYWDISPAPEKNFIGIMCLDFEA